MSFVCSLRIAKFILINILLFIEVDVGNDFEFIYGFVGRKRNFDLVILSWTLLVYGPLYANPSVMLLWSSSFVTIQEITHLKLLNYLYEMRYKRTPDYNQ